MAFKNHTTKEIIIDHEDDSHIYFAAPQGIRVSKSDYKIEKINANGEYEPAHFTWMGTKDYPRPAISIMYKLWNVPRMLAVAFKVPNPHNYKFVCASDPFDPRTMSWARSPSRAETTERMTSVSARNRALEDIPSGTPEYWTAYNSIKGKDRMTNSERYVQRRVNLGLVRVYKKKSPIGRQIWVSPELRVMINICYENGTINDPKVKESLIEKIKPFLNVGRKNKVYKRFPEI